MDSRHRAAFDEISESQNKTRYLSILTDPRISWGLHTMLQAYVEDLFESKGIGKIDGLAGMRDAPVDFGRVYEGLDEYAMEKEKEKMVEVVGDVMDDLK
eukprot:1379691-Amorphochlora_amoeboformis.AAC.1